VLASTGWKNEPSRLMDHDGPRIASSDRVSLGHVRVKSVSPKSNGFNGLRQISRLLASCCALLSKEDELVKSCYGLDGDPKITRRTIIGERHIPL
jgi:hypothetical protein